MSHCDFTGAGLGAAADQGDIGDCVMWLAKGAIFDQALAGGNETGDAVNNSGFQCFFKG